MMKPDAIVFATSRQDAKAACAESGLDFDKVVWVMNLQLLGNMDRTGIPMYASMAFRETPAWTEVAALLPPAPTEEAPIEGTVVNP